jgi:hypothetical protein
MRFNKEYLNNLHSRAHIANPRAPTKGTVFLLGVGYSGNTLRRMFLETSDSRSGKYATQQAFSGCALEHYIYMYSANQWPQRGQNMAETR